MDKETNTCVLLHQQKSDLSEIKLKSRGRDLFWAACFRLILKDWHSQENWKTITSPGQSSVFLIETQRRPSSIDGTLMSHRGKTKILTRLWPTKLTANTCDKECWLALDFAIPPQTEKKCE
jgi:hypothetical protein